MPFVYNLPVWDTISIGWEKTYGVKGTIWAAFLILIIISIALAAIQGVLNEASPGFVVVISLISNLITFLLQLGVLIIGIRRAQDLPVTYKLMFKTFEWEYAVRLIGLYILFGLIFGISAVLIFSIAFAFSGPIGIILASILSVLILGFFIVRLSVALPFVLDQQLGPVQAIRTSWKATRGNFWNVLAVILLQVLFIVISAIPLGIGLIWTLPFSYVTYGVMYRNLLNNLSSDVQTTPPVQQLPS